MKNFENYGVQELSVAEIKKTNGGILGLIAIAFWGGVAYGYVKEKLETKEWSL